MYYSTGCHPCPPPRLQRVGRQVQRAVRPGLGRLPRETLARQKRLGIVPPEDTELTERPELFPAWDTLGDDEKKLYARQMEVFAGFSRTPTGTSGGCSTRSTRSASGQHRHRLHLGRQRRQHGRHHHRLVQRDDILQRPRVRYRGAARAHREVRRHGSMGGEHTAPHFAAAWAHANNTPFPWGKQMASHLGGTGTRWWSPGRGASRRSNSAHPVHPLHRHRADHAGHHRHAGAGTTSTESHRSRWTERASPTPSTMARPERHTLQYFEMFGSRAIYKDGWWACTRLDKAPWDFSPRPSRASRPGL